MTKNFKLVLALILSIMMILGSVSALAADPTGSITIKPSSTVTLENKTLKAYKILNATYDATDTTKVSYTIPAALKSFYDEYFGTPANNEADPPVSAVTASTLAAAEGKTLDVYVTEKMAAWNADTSADPAVPQNTAEVRNFLYAALAAAKDAGVTAKTGAKDGDNVKFSALEAGYYVVEDEGTATPISSLMLDTVTNANVEIELKAEDNTEKVILPAGELVNQKADQLGLGRAVDYKVTQKIPDTTGYDYYYYMINDTLSKGLTFNPDSVIVKVGGTTLTEGTDYFLYYDTKVADTDPTYAANEKTKTILDGKTFIVAFKDIVSDIANAEKTTFVIGADVEITYNATVNAEAVNGVDPNTNKVNVEYSNNPDKDGKGDYDTDHPGIPLNDGNHPTGVGPDKWTDTYTNKIKVIKVDGSNNNAPLEGVEFTLTGTAKDANFQAWQVYEIDPAGTYWLLNNGTYTTTAPSTAPTVEVTTGSAGWVQISDADAATALAAGKAVRKIGNQSYRPYVEATDSALTRYKIIEENTGDYASTTTKYSLITKTSDAAEEYKVIRSGVTAGTTEASVSFEELGAGTYKLAETGVLAGYNGLPEIDFTLTCTLPEWQEGEDPNKTMKNFTGKEQATWALECTTAGYESAFTQQEDGTFVITLTNNTGVELPSTGGIGTTIFYVAGSIMVLAAAILLITKRRMGAND